ncbi:serine hydrolase [Runella sp. MFBS21]|uniref:serine hydrolase domain-containing protein n=1 Tax=Runella sp. MFBS21 TaxID=3034018 RepID=UPI0023F9967B|nr:serine hydrolase [Runella sp. MFBS21]MDF7816547.1 serine hydrolase [Runella sp. MFBS21]
MKRLSRNLLFGLVGLLLVGTGLTYTSPLVHIKNYVQRGDVDIIDYKQHPTRQVLASTRPEPWPLDSNFNKAVVSQNLLDTLEKYRTTAFLVFQDGKLLYEKYGENTDTSSLSQSFSAAKSIISMLVGIALNENKIRSLDQPVKAYLGAFAEGEKSKITIRHCLTMSTGLDWHEKDKGFFSNNALGYYGENIEGVIEHLDSEKPAGKEFEYRSGDTEILALILEKIYNKKIADLASEKIFQLIGSETDAVWMLDKPKGREKAFCCFALTARDFARFGHLMLWNGNWKGRQIVSEGYMKEAQRPASYLLDPKTQLPLQAYGYQFWMQSYKGISTVSMRGLLGQLIWAIPSKNAVVVRLGHKESPQKVENYFKKDSEIYLEAALQVLEQSK